MADVRSLPGIRYSAGTHLDAVVTPPYDVISPEEQARYYERDPHNIIRLELGRDEPADDELDNRYTRAARAFAEWRLEGVLTQDVPALYIYEQGFTVAGREHTRTSLLARVRLAPWDAGVILPHERTLSTPKADRLKLTRACAATLSPIMSLYDDPDHQLAGPIETVKQLPPDAELTDDAGEQHRLWVVREEPFALLVEKFFAARQLYIADGHHRYETALAYREVVRELRRDLPEEDATNFTLMGLTAIEDAGLVVLPTHRILRDIPQDTLDALDTALGAWFEMRQLDGDDASTWTDALAHDAEAQSNAFVLARPSGASLLRLRPEGAAAMATAAGDDAGTSEAWRGLDVAVLHELVLARALGITPDTVRAGQHVAYTRDPHMAIAAVRQRTNGAQIAVLLRATPPSAIRDVAQAGDRMPQKSTYFYPKLVTGLVINPLW